MDFFIWNIKTLIFFIFSGQSGLTRVDPGWPMKPGTSPLAGSTPGPGLITMDPTTKANQVIEKCILQWVNLRWSINKNYKDKIQDRTHPLIPVIDTVLATCASSIPTRPGKHSEINSSRTRNTQNSGRERLRYIVEYRK
jgi:hypothetical protein